MEFKTPTETENQLRCSIIAENLKRAYAAVKAAEEDLRELDKANPEGGPAVNGLLFEVGIDLQKAERKVAGWAKGVRLEVVP